MHAYNLCMNVYMNVCMYVCMYVQILQEGRTDMQKELELLKGRLETEKKHVSGLETPGSNGCSIRGPV